MKSDHPLPAVPKLRRHLARWAAWFCFANAFFYLIISWRYVAVMGFPEEPLAGMFLVFSALGKFSCIAMIPFLLIAPLAIIWHNRKAVFTWGVLLSGLLLLALVIDSLVFSLYRFHLNGMVWSLIRNGNLGEILPLSGNTFWIAGGIVAGVVAVESLLAFAMWQWINWTKLPRRLGALITVGVVVVVVIFESMFVWADAVQYVPITKTATLFPGGRPLTARRFLHKLGLIKKGNSTPNFTAGKTALNYPLSPVHCEAGPHPFNIMIIAIDCWRFDMLNEAATPNLWRFSQENIRFDQHSAAANTTRFGIFSLFYGLYGTYWHSMFGELRGPVLIDQLNQANYQFGIFASAPLTSPEFDRTVFAKIRNRIPLKTEGASAPDRDKKITEEMLAFLDKRNRDQPFFAFAFYDSTHAFAYPADAAAPFQPAATSVDHLKFNAKYDPTPLRNRFLNAVHFTDSLATSILERLKKESLLDNTVVLVTGDHGEEFNDSGQNYWGHNNNFSRYQTRVPLIVHWPGKPALVISNLTSHLDVAPTFLQGVLHCTTDPTNYSLGYSLFDPHPRIPLIAATWDRFAICSPGRIDVMYDVGYAESFDENYRKISTPIPPKYISEAIEGISRFHARRTPKASGAASR